MKNNITTVRLRLELKNDYLSDYQKRMLRRYGETTEQGTIIRDILVPSDMPLHNLHYTIQRLFGWQNSHLRSFYLPEDTYQTLTKGTVKGWSDLVGTLFQPPSEFEGDLFWDDDYVRGSFNVWLRKKYTGPYVYGGTMELPEIAERDVQELLDRFPMMDVRESFQDYMKRKQQDKETDIKVIKKAPLIECTLEEMNSSLMIDGGTESLLERLEVHKVLGAQGEKIGQTGLFPVTNELIYNYDFGDNWLVHITKYQDADDLIKQNMIDEHELEEAKNVVFTKHQPVCIHKEGVLVLDDVGGLAGFADFLGVIYEGEDKEEASSARAWARGFGWNNRKVSHLKML